MAEYIEREALLKELTVGEEYLDNDTMVAVFDTVVCFPAADVAPVVYAEWVWDDNAIDWGLGAWVCSKCHGRNDNIHAGKPGSDHSIGANPYAWAGSQFCPCCGAKMDGGSDG